MVNEPSIAERVERPVPSTITFAAATGCEVESRTRPVIRPVPSALDNAAERMMTSIAPAQVMIFMVLPLSRSPRRGDSHDTHESPQPPVWFCRKGEFLSNEVSRCRRDRCE